MCLVESLPISKATSLVPAERNCSEDNIHSASPMKGAKSLGAQCTGEEGSFAPAVCRSWENETSTAELSATLTVEIQISLRQSSQGNTLSGSHGYTAFIATHPPPPSRKYVFRSSWLSYPHCGWFTVSRVRWNCFCICKSPAKLTCKSLQEEKRWYLKFIDHSTTAVSLYRKFREANPSIHTIAVSADLVIILVYVSP